jgi:hypothetical protein
VGLTGLVDRGITPHPSFYHNPAFAPWPHNLDLRQVGYWMVRGWRIGHFLGKYISPWSFVRIAIGDRSWILKVKTEIKRQQTIEITPAREVIHLMFVELPPAYMSGCSLKKTSVLGLNGCPPVMLCISIQWTMRFLTAEIPSSFEDRESKNTLYWSPCSSLKSVFIMSSRPRGVRIIANTAKDFLECAPSRVSKSKARFRSRPA